ncbi:RNA polymerase sigma factor SigJ [Brevibacillus reuszeri]|uniref:RNA polymerase sigma factor SigJ n=1 Tax=Brevibacillus reuszeri TaxID=54915 RepID=A0A0K9YMV6_9BACL|nr:RNA polymerase sigma-70 factor [Brevibacillus reuszeri]KNB69977.1 RNA polymerase sigma24 factor [Brevibacillus reuszeri]MED1858345.1 RNA polymerase sigma-70 factor [Brevibacillus reuszeri]GED68656.1 RNA polymerase sigma factor SigJ [Brevibacillus reuszeri]
MEWLYQKYKGLLFSLAYQMIGSATDAEDIVQDVFVKAHQIQLEQMADPKAYLCKMTTNRCLDLLKSARKKRELYTGPWLPEPIHTPVHDSAESVVQKDLLSYAMLVLLEQLSETERAVFVLREALGFDYHEIAHLIGKSEANCRKISSRAKNKVGITATEEHALFAPEKSIEEQWISRFIDALEHGKMDTLLGMLAKDAVLLSDGGGKVSAAIHPIVSAERIAHFLLGIMRKTVLPLGLQVEPLPLNNQIGLLLRLGEQINTVVLLHVEENAISRLFFIRNPDKLQALYEHRKHE